MSLRRREDRVDAEKDGCGDESIPRLLFFSQKKEGAMAQKSVFPNNAKRIRSKKKK